MSIKKIAIRTEDGDIYSCEDYRVSRIGLLPCKLMKLMKNNTAGFLNHLGEFLDEVEALKEARECNQIPSIYFSAKTKLLSIHLT